jgi:hypothetical protein
MERNIQIILKDQRKKERNEMGEKTDRFLACQLKY